jgi:hypothetical protein
MTLCQINSNLCDAKGTSAPFGGLHSILAGDQFRFPPIGDVPLYKRCSSEELNKYNMTYNSKTKQRYINTSFGRWLWKQKTHCVILTQSMRQQNDLVYAALLERVKYGKCTEEDYKLLQSRIYNNPSYRNSVLNKETSRIILSRNSIRAQTNLIMAKDFCQKYNRSSIKSNSKDTWLNKGKESNYSLDLLIKYRLRCIEESKSEKLCFSLDLVVGCNYILTKNIATPIGLTNNTYVKLEKIITLETPTEENINKLSIACLLVSRVTPTETPTKSLFTNLEPHLFPIFPFTAYFKLSVPGISTSNSLKKNKNTINIKRTQYPLMLAFAVTCNNQQGSTVESGIIDLSKPLDGYLQEAYTNVGLSRFRKLDDLTIIDDFDIEILQQQPDIDLLIEENEYKKLANKTLDEYYSTHPEYCRSKDTISLQDFVKLKNQYFIINPDIEKIFQDPVYSKSKIKQLNKNKAAQIPKLNQIDKLEKSCLELPYYLKLANNNQNRCYSNTAIQLLITCDTFLFETIKKVQSQCELSTMLHSYIQSYVNKEINEFSTENILNIITKERQSCLLDNDMSGDNFTDNGQHDIFDLLRHFLNLVRPLVKQLFTYSTYYTFECECSNMITTASMDNCIYELTTLTNYLHFNDFFEPRMIFQNCDNCNSNQKREKIHFSTTNRYLLPKSEFIIIQ